ncbi:uncharacterized protein LOC122861678 [Xyrichtys novacula]|uniref:Uncharacterized protein LOC122861678 n=1 Tax=Xyrichtys novacula TaxID=13765 RepID=A0AAV1GJE4_XYRNO|nr:uncharacterized protein LOC122861678 [Xyrichtys novacula]
MGKPLSRPGCFRKSSCCLEKHGAGDGGMGVRAGGMDVGYGDGYIPQRSIYDTMCINQQIDSHHHPGGSIRRDCEGSFSYSASGSLRVGRSPVDMFDPQPRSLTPNPSFVRRLDERAIYDSLKLGGQDADGGGCHSPGHYNRSVSPSVSSFSAPGVSSSSSKKHHHHHHHHGDSTKNRDVRQSWKVITPPKHLECLELTTTEMMDRGGGYLNPGHYPPPGGQSSSLTSPLISPFSGSPLSSGYHTPVFFSPAKPRPSQTQSLRCSPPQVIQPRHYSQTQSLRLSPPHELRRSPYRAPLVQLSAHDLEQDLRERGGGWGRAMSEREREWEREREREMERGWAQREWERERERGRLERERARERERRETSTFGTFGYGRQVPLRSDRDSVFLEPDQALDTTPLLLPTPSPSPSPNAAPRMGTGAVGRNRAGSKVGHDSISGGMVPKYDNGGVGLVLVDSKSGPRLVSEVGPGNMSEVDMRAGVQDHHRAESWGKYDNGSRANNKHGSETRMGSQVKTRPGGRELEGKVQSGMEIEKMAPAVHKESQSGGTRNGERNGRIVSKPEPTADLTTPTVKDTESNTVPGDRADVGAGPGPAMKPIVEEKVSPQQVENRTAGEPGGVAYRVNHEIVAAPEPKVEAKVETESKNVPQSKPEALKDISVSAETGTKGTAEVGVLSESQSSIHKIDKAQIRDVGGDKTEVAPAGQTENKPLELDSTDSSHTEKISRSQKSKSSKSSSRTRPGTATGLRPGVVSPRLSRGLGDLESTGPPEGIESTWPRRIMVRKRTVRQGGALHNLPILPPLPSVLSALEKRRPHGHLHRVGHYSENPLTSLINSTSMVGRCSLKEPSHPDLGLGAGLVGRASLKEQNLEHWRVCRELDEPKRSRSKEKQGQSQEKLEREEKKSKEELRERERKEERDKKEEKVGREKEKVPVSEGMGKEIKQPKLERRVEGKEKREGIKKEIIVEVTCEKIEDTGIKIRGGIPDQHGQELEEVVAKIKKDDGELEGGEGEEGGMESWDAVLEMVTTLWDDGWDNKGAGEGEGDTDSISGSLQRWPLLRPPVGFGGSHPPSSAASELSLTEIERRARELDSDLEHLDLSQPQRDTQDAYQSLLEPQRDRGDMYQTHPGPQREKATVYTGMGSRSQVTLELNPMALLATDTDRHPADWQGKSAGTATVVTCATKEDSSPDSNLTLESDSSGIFMSLSNQSQEEGGSDSDQPISGSDLGSSNTSLEKDGDDGGPKEWGREESSELQWCYPSLLNTSMQEDTDIQDDTEREEPRREKMEEGGEKSKEESGRRVGKIATVSIIRAPLNHAHSEVSTNFSAPQSEEVPSRKKVTLIRGDTPLPLSPSKQQIKHLLDPNQKAIRSSGLDCGDIDPFVQSDSFVYLAVTARPGEATKVTEVPTHVTQQDNVQQHSDSMKTNLNQSNTEGDAKPTHLTPQKPEEGDFLCTDSFVYLAAPACLLLGPAGSTQYSGRESDSESSGSGAADVSVLGCGSVAGDSDWDSDLSDSDPSRSSRFSAAANKSAGVARPKRLPTEPDWDMVGDPPEPDVLNEPFTEEDRNNNGEAKMVTTSIAGAQAMPRPTHAVTTQMRQSTMEQSSTKKVTWQFKPAQRSVCTGSRKEKDKEMTSSRFTEYGGDSYGPSPSSSSSSSSSPSSSSSG